MSRNIFHEDDEPLFSKNDQSQSGVHNKKSTTPTLEEYKFRQENERKNQVLFFGIKSVKWVLLFGTFLVVADFVAQANGWDSALIKEFLSLLTYTATAALGFIFGSSAK